MNSGFRKSLLFPDFRQHPLLCHEAEFWHYHNLHPPIPEAELIQQWERIEEYRVAWINYLKKKHALEQVLKARDLWHWVLDE